MSPYVRMLRARLGSFKLLMPSVSAHIFDNDRLLLVRQRDGNLWSTPGGSIEPDERPEEAVIRKVEEETGLRVTKAWLVGAFGGPEFVVKYPNGDETQYVILAYACEVADGSVTAVPTRHSKHGISRLQK